MKRFAKRLMALALILTIIFSFACLPTSGLTYNEAYSQLISAGFPASYAKKLANVKVAHPNWEFKVMKVNLDWDYVVEQELNPGACTVWMSTGASTTRLYASRSLGTYTSGDGLDYTYVKRDGGTGGFYTDASKLAVSEYMNPLHFIGNDVTVLMFEELGWGDLNYDSAVATVESMLSGTFMSSATKNTNYVDASGNIKYVTTSGTTGLIEGTYASVICTAAQAAKINPFYFTSKIIGEVCLSDGSPSGSVSGTYGGYTGYYNYLNINASDSATGEAIASGLSYAKSKGWDNPKTAIEAGAEFLSSGYIKAGQDTAYLQKFNVSTNSIDTSHQYMTAVNGVHYMLQKTYDGYVSSNTLENVRTFKIPVYNNMPDGTGTDIWFSGYSNTGTVTSDKATVRTAATYTGDNLASSYPKNTVVTLSAGVHNTGSEASTNTMLYGPLWYKLSTGHYMIEEYVEVSATAIVNKGSTVTLTTKQTSGSTEKPRFMSWDTRIATVDSNGKVTGVSAGTTKVVAYLSNGAFAVINVKVSSTNANGVPTSATSGTYSVNDSASFISQISLGTTVAQLLAGINERNYITVTKNGTAISGDTVISTGCVVSIMDGSSVVKSYTTIVTGDLNGDGAVTASDSLGIRDYILGASDLSTISFKAADLNADGKITAADSLGIRDYLLGVSGITPKAY